MKKPWRDCQEEKEVKKRLHLRCVRQASSMNECAKRWIDNYDNNGRWYLFGNKQSFDETSLLRCLVETKHASLIVLTRTPIAEMVDGTL
jgi:hypothetical protein